MRRNTLLAALLLAIFAWGCSIVTAIIDRKNQICRENPELCGQATPSPTPSPTPEPTPEPTPTPTPEPTPEPRLPAPDELHATPGNGQVALAWSPVTGAAAYRIFRGNMLAELADAVGTSYVATEIPNGDEWCFWVAGISQSGEIGRKAMACATPSAPLPIKIRIVAEAHYPLRKPHCAGAARCMDTGDALVLKAQLYDAEGNVTEQPRDWAVEAVWTVKHSSGCVSKIVGSKVKLPKGNPWSNACNPWCKARPVVATGVAAYNAEKGPGANVYLDPLGPSGSIAISVELRGLTDSLGYEVRRKDFTAEELEAITYPPPRRVACP